TEALRSAILDALAHEFKTPLATILTAAGGLRVPGTGENEQAELTDMIETEASRLGDLTTRLLRLARVDREEWRPRLETIDAVEIAQRAVRRYSRLRPERCIAYCGPPESSEVKVDPELIDLALSQVVENACRYAWPGTGIRIQLAPEDGQMAITV